MKYLGNSPENLFQRIKRYVAEYEAENGKGSSINVAVGEPDTCPPKTLRALTAKWVMNESSDIHTYWDNRDPGNFCRNMIQRITGLNTNEYDHLDTLVLPGEKAMLGLLPIACGANRDDVKYVNHGFVRTAPAYDLVGQWADYLGEEAYVWPLVSAENFKLNLDRLPKLKKPPRMIITVKPGNPCPAGAGREDWESLIKYCVQNNVRLVNDAAYTSLTHKDHTPLCTVAKDYPELDWMEYFSISKTMSACGWRLGAAVGSQDFIGELTKVKGNADSGPFGPALVASEEYFGMAESEKEITDIQKMYERRLEIAIPIFENAGFKLACPTDAGFFMLFHCPKFMQIQSRNTKSSTIQTLPTNRDQTRGCREFHISKSDKFTVKNSEDFNKKMINAIGLVGVPFSGAEVDGEVEQFIRYSVCADFEDVAFAKRVEDGLVKVEVGY